MISSVSSSSRANCSGVRKRSERPATERARSAATFSKGAASAAAVTPIISRRESDSGESVIGVPYGLGAGACADAAAGFAVVIAFLPQYLGSCAIHSAGG